MTRTLLIYGDSNTHGTLPPPNSARSGGIRRGGVGPIFWPRVSRPAGR